MEIHFFISHWGNEHLSPEQFFREVKDAGYDGIEYNICQPVTDLWELNLKMMHFLKEKITG